MKHNHRYDDIVSVAQGFSTKVLPILPSRMFELGPVTPSRIVWFTSAHRRRWLLIDTVLPQFGQSSKPRCNVV